MNDNNEHNQLYIEGIKYLEELYFVNVLAEMNNNFCF